MTSHREAFLHHLFQLLHVDVSEGFDVEAAHTMFTSKIAQQQHKQIKGPDNPTYESLRILSF